MIEIVLSDIANGGTFTQNHGLGILELHENSSVTESNGRLIVSWLFEVTDWDDVQI